MFCFDRQSIEVQFVKPRCAGMHIGKHPWHDYASKSSDELQHVQADGIIQATMLGWQQVLIVRCGTCW